MKKILATMLAFVTVFSTVSFAAPAMADTDFSAGEEAFVNEEAAADSFAEALADEQEWETPYGDLLFYIDFENTSATVKNNTEIAVSEIGGVNPDYADYGFKFQNSCSQSGTVVSDDTGNRYFTFKNSTNQYPQVNLNFTNKKLPTNGRYIIVADVMYKQSGASGGTLQEFDFKPRVYNNAFKSGENETPWAQLNLGTVKVGDGFPAESWKTATASYYYPTFSVGNVVYDSDYYGTILVPFKYSDDKRPTTPNEDTFAIDNIRLYFQKFEEKADPVYGDLLFDIDFDSVYDASLLRTREKSSLGFNCEIQNTGYVNPKYIKNKDIYFKLYGDVDSSNELVKDENGNVVLKFSPGTSNYPQAHIDSYRKLWGGTKATFSSTIDNEGNVTENPGIYTMKADYKLVKGEGSTGFKNVSFGGTDVALGDYSKFTQWGWGAAYTKTEQWVKDATMTSKVAGTSSNDFTVDNVKYNSAGKTEVILCATYDSGSVKENDVIYFDNIRLYYRPIKDTVTISMGDNTLAKDVSFEVDYSASGTNTTMTKSELMKKITDWGDKILVDVVKADGTTLGNNVNLFENTDFKAVWKDYKTTTLSVDFKDAKDKIETNSKGEVKSGYTCKQVISYNNEEGYATVKFEVTDSEGKAADTGVYDANIKLAAANGNGTTKILDTAGFIVRMRVRNAKSESATFVRGNNTTCTYAPGGGFVTFMNVDNKNGEFLQGYSGAHAKRSITSDNVNYNRVNDEWFTIYVDLTNVKGYEHISPGDRSKDATDVWGANADNYWWNEATILKLFRLDFPDFGVWNGMEFDFDFIHFIEREDVNPHAYNVSSVRTDEYTGVRFMSSVTAAQKAKVTEYGYIIARDTVLGDTELTHDCGKKFASGVAYNKNDGTNLVYDVDNQNNIFFTAVLYGVPEDMYNDVLVARSYTKTADGTYSYGSAVKRSTYEVAKAVKDNADVWESLRDDAQTKISDIISKAEAQNGTEAEA